MNFLFHFKVLKISPVIHAFELAKYSNGNDLAPVKHLGEFDSDKEKSISKDTRHLLDVTIPELLLQYKPEFIHNVDETGLFSKFRPEDTIV